MKKILAFALADLKPGDAPIMCNRFTDGKVIYRPCQSAAYQRGNRFLMPCCQGAPASGSGLP